MSYAMKQRGDDKKKANISYSQIPSTDIKKIGVWQSVWSSIYSIILKIGPILTSKLSHDELRANQQLTFKNCACYTKTILCSNQHFPEILIQEL